MMQNGLKENHFLTPEFHFQRLILGFSIQMSPRVSQYYISIYCASYLTYGTFYNLAKQIIYSRSAARHYSVVTINSTSTYMKYIILQRKVSATSIRKIKSRFFFNFFWIVFLKNRLFILWENFYQKYSFQGRKRTSVKKEGIFLGRTGLEKSGFLCCGENIFFGRFKKKNGFLFCGLRQIEF